jgi:hypothetical protein
MSFGATFMGEAADKVEHDDQAPPTLFADRFEQLQRRWADGDPNATIEIANVLVAVIEGKLTVTAEQRAWLEERGGHIYTAGADYPMPTGRQAHRPQHDLRVEAHAANQARAAARSVLPGIDMQVVLSGVDALRAVAYRGLNALARKIDALADRLCP